MSTVTPMLLFARGQQQPVWRYQNKDKTFVAYGKRTVRPGFVPLGNLSATKWGCTTEPSTLTVLKTVVVPKGQTITLLTPNEGFIEQDSWFQKF